MALWQPVLQRIGQKLLLFGVVGYVACTYTQLTIQPINSLSGISLLPPRLLGGRFASADRAAGRMPLAARGEGSVKKQLGFVGEFGVF